MSRSCQKCAIERQLTLLSTKKNWLRPACVFCGRKGITALYSHPAPSPRLERFLRYVAAKVDHDAPGIDDAADMLRGLSDQQLSVICGETPGDGIVFHLLMPSLNYSSLLRYRIQDELDELELSLPDNALGLLTETGVTS